jgi:outer-membrane receptor for ferric coprogen and ferric-rhodotorulic acid
MMMNKGLVRSALIWGAGRALPGIALATVMAVTSAQAAAPDATRFDIEAQPLGTALAAFTARTGITLSYGSTLPNVNSEAVKGEMAPAEALSRLLVGSGLTYRFTGPRAVVLEPAPTVSDGAMQLGPVRVAGDDGSQDAGDIPTPRTDRAATDRSHSYAARKATVAGKTAQDLREIPQSVSVVTRQRLDDQNIVTLEQALRQTTGVTSIPYGDGAAYYQVRGYPAEIQYDGIPANSAVQYQSQFDIGMYDRVELLRGPSGLLQGAGNPAGTINLVRKRPHDSFGWAASLMGGSWNNFHGDLDVTGPLNAAKTLRGRFVAAGDDRDFFYDKGHEKHGLIYGILEFDIAPDTTLTFSGSWQDQKQGPLDYGQSLVAVPPGGQFLDAPRSAFFGTDWSRSITHTRDAYASLDHDFGNGWAAKASLDYRQQRLTGPYGYIAGLTLPNLSTTYALQNQYVLNKWLGTDVNVSGPVQLFGRTHHLLFGANYAWQGNVSYWGSTTVPVADVFHIDIPETVVPFTGGSDIRTEQFGAYAQGRFSLADPLTLVAAVRVTDYRAKERDAVADADGGLTIGRYGSFYKTARVSGHVTPTVGLIYDVTHQISLYGSYATIFVPQSGDQVFGGGALKPRTGEQFEVGAKGSFLNGALTASAALFSLSDRNRAFGDPEHAGFYLAVGKARSRGAEAEISGEPLPGWNLYAGYTYLVTKYLDDESSAGLIFDTEEPRHNLKLWSSYRFGAIERPGFQIGGGVRVMSKTSRGGPYQPTYAVADAQVGFRLNGQWSATLSVNNLFDKSYYARVPSRLFGIYGEPRSFTVALRKSF